MTRGEIRALVYDWVDDPTGAYFTPAIVNVRINLAQRELQKNLISANKQYYTKYVETNLVAQQSSYAVPSDFIQVVRLEYVTQGTGDTATTRPILPMTPNQKDNGDATQGTPGFYYFDKNNLVLRPVPNQVMPLRLLYSYRVADMVSDSDTPDVPEQFVEYLPILVVRDCFLKDGRPLDPILDKMDQYKKLLIQIAEQRNVDKPRMVTMTAGSEYGDFGTW